MSAPIPFYKYHALGNDYIVLNPAEAGDSLTVETIQLICHRNYGIGSDGILLGPIKDPQEEFALKIFNPDGSQAEKSGNGLRIFTRYLWDHGFIDGDHVTIHTAGGTVNAQVYESGKLISVDMGTVSFDSRIIPVEGPEGEVINQKMEVNGQTLEFCAATIGNPHCVILKPEISAAEAKEMGPLIEVEPRFPNRTNVQFMKIVDRSNIQIEIWERGAGYTLASGSSSSAAAAVAHRLGLCDSQITVHMPGGKIEIKIAEDFAVSMTGTVTRVAEGVIHPEMFGQ
ncbi:Diaminopimelate epimerase (EC [Olavius sp. associated proteobacterium Delta 1]|nr:Diaminopimelate epimerase (EC [Olavius sp. associated proteobacterium Delta 1]